MKNITRDFSGNFYWESYSNNLEHELTQSLAEGLDIDAHKELFDLALAMPLSEKKEEFADKLFGLVLNAPVKKDFMYNEPSELEKIKEERIAFNLNSVTPEKDTLYDKISGAWFGRICGCLLGKPLEGIRTNELIPLLKETENYPLHRYIESSDITQEMIEKYSFGLKNKCWADTINCAPVDDDTNYTVMAQYIIEKYGKDFTSTDVAKTWFKLQPIEAYFTAEKVAFINLVNGYAPPNSAIYKNPFREWIGAQIRGDYFGFINPGNPEKAAEMAFRDASISHIKNGIYGEMFVAAMLATAAVNNDIQTVIKSGLAQIPKNSRLYHSINKITDMYNNKATFEECYRLIHSEFDEHTSYGWCHTISNAMIVCAALLYGEGDFSKSICLAVSTGFDTDCNGATVGAITGMLGGKQSIDEKWTSVLNGTLNTSILDIGKVKIEDLIETTMKHIYL